jgi:acetolactate synthase-1/2/3 large subunit
MLVDAPAIATVRNEAEVILIVGSRLGEYDGWGMPPVWGDPDKQKTIQIDADPYSIGLNRPVNLGIVADAKLALQALLEAVRARVAARPAMPDIERYRAMSAERRAQLLAYRQTPATQGVNPAQMVAAARNFFPRDAITVLDGGNTVLTSLSYYPILAPNSFVYSVKMGYLGTGLPFAIGAKIADRQRPVCLITGDGAIGFCIMEMETALRLKAPVTVVVAVDQGWGMERPVFLMRGFTPDQFVGIDLSPEVRYDLIAQGLGCFGEKVDDISQLPEALERASKSGKPALIHVSVDPSLNVTPPGMDTFRYWRTL